MNRASIDKFIVDNAYLITFIGGPILSLGIISGCCCLGKYIILHS